MAVFKKRQTAVQAMRLDMSSYKETQEVIDWMNECVGWTYGAGDPPAMRYYERFTIRTPRGDIDVKDGDWIVRDFNTFYALSDELMRSNFEEQTLPLRPLTN